MENKNVLDAGDIPQVAMDAMNDVHRNELNIVNELNAAIFANDPEKVTQLCDSWLEHTQVHFDRENSMMETYGFPAYHCHHGEHVEAIQGLESILNTWKKDNDLLGLAEYVRNIWPKWYVNHISTMDVVTSAFIKQSIENG
ncbi:MAG: bacteriohemerythrin [Methylococcaceae bacterium]